jgi:hypothetical protein
MRLPNLPLRTKTAATLSAHLSFLIITVSSTVSSVGTEFFLQIPEIADRKPAATFFR